MNIIKNAGRRSAIMSKVEDILASTKVGDVLDAAKLNKFLKKKEEEEKKPSKFVIVFAVMQQQSMEFIVSLHRIIWMISRTILKMSSTMTSSRMRMKSRLQSLRMLPQTRQRTNHCRKRENFQAVWAVRRKRKPNKERRDCSCVVPFSVRKQDLE